MPRYSVLLTRGATESVTVEVEVDSDDPRVAEEAAEEKAGRYGENVSGWEVDEGNQHEVYICDPGECAELIEEDETLEPLEEIQPTFKCDWTDDDRFVFLGTEKNPNTGRVYDYWLARLSTGTSWTCRHGEDPADYGSGPLGGTVQSAEIVARTMEDYIFGCHRAEYFALYYRVTGKCPLLGKF